MFRWYLVMVMIVGVLHLALLSPGIAQEKVLPSDPAYQKALAVAKVVDDLVRATRKHYTDMVVWKLASDGAGATLDYRKTKGYVPLPASFVKRVAFETNARQIARNQWRYDVSLISRYNLNDLQGISAPFHKRGWNFLAKQQDQHLTAGQPLKDLIWEPYIEIGKSRGQVVMNYFSADPASSKACVTCHNGWEQKEETQARRKRQGVKVGKVFQMHELMGALAITVPLYTEW